MKDIKYEDITGDIARKLTTEQLIQIALGNLHAEPWMIIIITEIVRRLQND